MSSPKAAETIVDIRNFKMSFGDKVVIKDLSFQVNKGEVFGFLGSNGSGKTTTIRALLGIYQPTGGELLIGGQTFSKESVIDVMVYFGQLNGLTKTEARARSIAYLERVRLADKAETRLDKLSGGQQQKVQLGITIMHNPSLLILDEPTKGFDPVNRRLLMDIIEEHREKGATIIFVTHQMEEVERLCDRIILLKNGTSRAYGTIPEVKALFNGASLDDIFIQVYSDENEEKEGDE